MHPASGSSGESFLVFGMQGGFPNFHRLRAEDCSSHQSALRAPAITGGQDGHTTEPRCALQADGAALSVARRRPGLAFVLAALRGSSTQCPPRLMTDSNAAPHQLTLTHWLIIIIASIGFAFDTYELLMTPLAAPPAIAELLRVPINNPLVTEWMGRLLWITALCGGVFGLMGGWLIDRFGRKSVMAASIFVYSFSPVLAAFSTSIGLFLFFRCTTFIGVCVEFVAAISWLAEVFTDKKQRVKWLGITQAFASVGGLMVTGVNVWIVAHAQSFPHFGMPIAMGGEHPASWRYLLLTGLIPALPIALLLPFVPESRLWQEQKRAGTLKRPSFRALFTPALRRVTLVTAGLSACAYGVAFGALQLTPLRIAPGLPGLETERKARAPLVQEARQLNEQLNAAQPGSR